MWRIALYVRLLRSLLFVSTQSYMYIKYHRWLLQVTTDTNLSIF